MLDKQDNENELLLCACYFTPADSSRGDTREEQFRALLSQIYLYACDSPFLILGDINARIGNSVDYIESFDTIPNRIVIDNTSIETVPVLLIF